MNYFPQTNMNANSNYFPNYNPGYQVPSTPQAQNNGLIWVQGEAGAKSYLVAPNSTVMLMDSEGSRFYIKSADNAGMPTLKTYVYHQEGATAAPNSADNTETVDFIKRDEFAALSAKIEELEKKMAEESKKADRLAKIKKAVTDDE